MPEGEALTAAREWLIPGDAPHRECPMCGCTDYHALRCPAVTQPSELEPGAQSPSNALGVVDG